MSESTNKKDYIQYIGRAMSTLIILTRLYQDKEHSGYSLIKKIKELTNGKLRFRAGTIYSQIDKLSEQGLITLKIQDISSREGLIRQKSVYSLSKRGMMVLEQMHQEWKDVHDILEMIL